MGTQKMKEFVASRPVIQETLKKILHKEEMISSGNINLCKEMKSMERISMWINIAMILCLKKLLNNIRLIIFYTEDNLLNKTNNYFS